MSPKSRFYYFINPSSFIHHICTISPSLSLPFPLPLPLPLPLPVSSRSIYLICTRIRDLHRGKTRSGFVSLYFFWRKSNFIYFLLVYLYLCANSYDFGGVVVVGLWMILVPKTWLIHDCMWYGYTRLVRFFAFHLCSFFCSCTCIFCSFFCIPDHLHSCYLHPNAQILLQPAIKALGFSCVNFNRP